MSDLTERARAVRHRECEDSWYSCPEAAEGCCDDTQTGCTCTVPLIRSLAARIEELERVLAIALHAVKITDNGDARTFTCAATPTPTPPTGADE